MNIKILFGTNVRLIRMSKGLSQEKLAEICRLHRTYIGSVERGERNVSLINIQKISDALDVEIKELFNKN